MSPNETIHINGRINAGPVPVTNGYTNGVQIETPKAMAIAICGMACRLPGNLNTPQQLWDFVVSKGDARSRVPASRYNIDGFHDADRTGAPGGIKTAYSYFLDESADLRGFDTSFFSLSRAELERLDPTHRQMLEVAREALDDAGEVGWRGGNVGCYMGSFGEEWEDLFAQDNQQHGIYRLTGYGDFMLSNRLSYEMDLKGPSMVIRTGCSASLVALHEACRALQSGDCTSALVGGANLILGPGLTQALTEQGVLSPEGSCKSFSADADGYARAEAINAIYIKPLDDAIRDGNPIRAVIRGTATNGDGKTPGVTVPNSDAHETMIRHAYASAGIKNPCQTGYVECHGTGTTTGDPLEANAVARVFGDVGVHIGSVKPNVGHSEGASGLTSLIKTVLALENRVVPPSIKCNPPNPNIPFKQRKLIVPPEPTSWPADRLERASVNSFGIGGTNAHVILDSASSILPPRPASPYSTAPQLLIYSAASVDSLNKTITRYQELVDKNPDINLCDLAFTLATKREHFAHRSFAIAVNGVVGSAAPPTRALSSPPKIVMVFTGQGAQWPRMGHELLQTNEIFAASIRALDKYLTDEKGVEWSIEAELLKPARTSNIQKAELSQPLCTAIQVGLVDALRAVGVTACAVVGHSSGELGAAYAAGALTATEAITAAWRRGLVTQQQTKAGAMAAIGMGWAEVEPFLVPGKVGVACENSGDSVTLSGDAEAVQTVCAAIQKDRPDVLVRLLKVDKAYHSHHMVEIGDAYHALIEHDIFQKQPAVPFFSSVHGRLLREDDTLGARYWQQNLESTVRFREAVTAILQTEALSSNAMFLEIGPHSALAGPLRQIVAANGAHEKGIPYVAAMLRAQDCAASFLASVGKLQTLGSRLDWAALFPSGKTLADLPRYAWDHQDGAVFWYESRLTSEWRNRRFKHHPLLGLRLPETSDFEPVWRNVFHLDSAAWVRDHKVGDDTVFPAAGYIAMIGEAVRQVSGVDAAFSLRHVVVGAATVLTEGKTMEFTTSLRKHRLTETLDSDWWEFTIASHNGAVWTKHCTGQAKAHAAEDAPRAPVSVSVSLAGSKDGAGVDAVSQPLPRPLGKKRAYEKLSQIGVNYGPRFQVLDSISSGTVTPQARAQMANGVERDSSLFHLHPTLLDAALQLNYVAATKGWSLKHPLAVPTGFELLTVTRTSDEPQLHLDVWADMGAGGHTVGNVKVTTPGGRVVVSIANAHMSPIGGGEDDSAQGPLTTARLEWGQHIDFVDTASLIKPSMDRAETTPQLDELHRLCLVYSQRCLRGKSTKIAHMQKFQAWVDRQLKDTAPALVKDLHSAPLAQLIGTADALVQQLASTPAKDAAVALRKVLVNIEGIFDGSVNSFEVLLTDSTLYGVYSFINECDLSGLITTLAHTKPNLRILEIGAGTGTATAGILKSLVAGEPTNKDRRVLYSRYTFTDLSAGFFVAAKERFKDFPNMEFATLDISKDPSTQGFDLSDPSAGYDLILATNVLHATAPLAATLSHVCKLLAPDGRLLLHELHSTSKWVNYIFGTLAGWWYGEDEGRADEPYLTPAQWETQLKAAGFRGLDAAVLDSAEPWHMNAVMVARPALRTESLSKRTDTKPKKAITLVLPAHTCPGDDKTIQPVADELRRRYTVTEVRLGQSLPAGQHAIALLEYGTKAPFFSDMDTKSIEDFKNLVGSSAAGVLWVTPLCQQQKQQGSKLNDPGYAQVIGTARTLRVEKSFHVGTVEVDDVTNAASAVRVVDVFERFRTHEGDATLAPDYEYAVLDGTVQVGRYFPFSLQDEVLAAPLSAQEGVAGVNKIALDIETRPRLDTLHWAPKDTELLVGDEVLVETYAAGLNFKDVLGALGIIDLPVEGLGHEAAGIIRATGPDVKDIQVGDRVMLLGFGSFASHITTTERCCGRIPNNLSFDDAATMPTVYATAIYSLFDVGGLSKGQSILIHSACGGVGIAAIQLARMVGADIHVTVGNDDKVQYLVDTFQIPRTRIYNSRNDSFVEGVMRETEGVGVDLVLNSLSGELLHATWRCVAEFGKLVEIGKRDLMEGGKLDMDVFLANRSYLCVDLGQLQRKRGCYNIYKELLTKVATYHQEGHILPIRPIKVFDASSTLEAYLYMQEGKHMGKIVLSLRDEKTDNSKIDASKIHTPKTPKAFRLDSSASYLLVGGLGGIGKSLARNMAEHGARHLVFLARSADSPANEPFCRELDSLGCKVSLVKGSVTNKGDVEKAVATATNLKGVLQLSMVLCDEAWDRMTAEQWAVAAGPKVVGTWNLHEATASADVDFFVLASSVSGIFGQPGQANYAAANTFLDAFVQYRAALGLAASCVDIGAMEDVGYVSQTEGLLQRMRHTGFWTIPEDELLEALAAAMKFPRPAPAQKKTFVLGLASRLPLDHPDNQASWKRDRRMAFYHNAVKAEAEGDGSTNVLKQLLKRIKEDTTILKKPEMSKVLAGEIGKKLAGLLLQPEEDMEPSRPLSELGMDSLVAIQVRNWWKSTLEFDISVLEMLALGTLDALGKHAVDGLLKAFS